MPAGVSPAAVSEAGDVPDEDLIRAEAVSVGASRRWVGDPLPGRRPHQFAQHIHKRMTVCRFVSWWRWSAERRSYRLGQRSRFGSAPRTASYDKVIESTVRTFTHPGATSTRGAAIMADNSAPGLPGVYELEELVEQCDRTQELVQRLREHALKSADGP
jgi:hypothetical protein